MSFPALLFPFGAHIYSIYICAVCRLGKDGWVVASGFPVHDFGIAFAGWVYVMKCLALRL